MTYGIIFFDINITKHSVYVYIQRNSNEEYQDILISEPIDIGVLYYVKNSDYNHIIYLLDITKYNELFTKYKIYLEKINYDVFNKKIFHNNLKHRRIKNFLIKRELDLILLNYKLIKKYRSI